MSEAKEEKSGNKPLADPSSPAGPVGPAAERDVERKPEPAKEIGGREGPDPTRYGDWEKAGRCIDF